MYVTVYIAQRRGYTVEDNCKILKKINKMARVIHSFKISVFLGAIYYLTCINNASGAPTNTTNEETAPSTPLKISSTQAPTNASATVQSSVVFSISNEVTAAKIEEAEILETPIPQRGTFLLRDNDDRVCLKAKFVIVFKVYYKSKLSEQEEASISLPANASVSGKCNVPDGTTVLTLRWRKYVLNFTFKETADERWVGNKIQFTYDENENPDFDKAVNPDVCVVQSAKEATFFGTKLGWSRTCRSEHDITLESDKKDRVVMQISELRLQPFDLVNGTFGTETHCKADKEPKNSNTASIVVGLMLAVFTLVVIVGYAIGRKTGYISERPGYSTME